MKLWWLYSFLVLILPVIAVAAENGQLPQAQPHTKTALAAQKPAVVVVDGKRFFPLQNARHFTGGIRPSGLAVLRQARPQGIIVTRGTQSSRAMPSPSLPMASTGGTKADPGDVLSIFSPEDKIMAGTAQK